MANKGQLTEAEVRAAESIAKIQLYLRQRADLNLSAKKVDTIKDQFAAINKTVHQKEHPRPVTDFISELGKLEQELSNAMKTESSKINKNKKTNVLDWRSTKQQARTTVDKMSAKTSDQSKASQVKQPALPPQFESETKKVRFSDVTQSASSSVSKNDSSEINLTTESEQELARMEAEIFNPEVSDEEMNAVLKKKGSSNLPEVGSSSSEIKLSSESEEELASMEAEIFNPEISDQEMKDYNERKRTFNFKVSSQQEMTVRRSLVMKSDELTTLADDTVQIKIGDSTFSIPKTSNGITVTVKTPIETLEAEIKGVFEQFPEAIYTATSTGTEEHAMLERIRGVMNITSTTFDEMIRSGKGPDTRTSRIDRTMDIYKALLGYTSDKAMNLRDQKVFYDPARFNALQAKIEAVTRKNPLSNEDKTEVQRLMGQLNSMTTVLEQRAASLKVDAQDKNSAFADSVPMMPILLDKSFAAMGDVIRIERSRTDALAKMVEELVGPEMQKSKEEAAQISEVPQVPPTSAHSPMPKHPPLKPVIPSEEPVALERQIEGRLRATVTLMKAKLKELQPEALEKINAQTAAQIKGLNDFQAENQGRLTDGMKKQCAAMIKNLKSFMRIAEGQRKNATVGRYSNALNNLANISKYMIKSEDMSYLRKNIAILKEAIQITMIQQSKVEGKDKKFEVKGDLKLVLDGVAELDKRMKKVENALPMFKGFRKAQFNDQLKKMGQDPIKQALTNIMANKNPEITSPVPPRNIGNK